MSLIYEPAEDSHLLQTAIQKTAFPDVKHILDMGTGSGILAKTCAKAYPKAHITAVDKNKDAIAFNQNTKTIKYKYSDLFSHVKKKFDLIVCNPPYLPAHAYDPDDMLTQALVGGKKGYEFIEQFLTKAKDHLTAKGKIFLLFSSLSKKQVVDKIIDDQLYTKKLLASQYVGMMETLFVYELAPLSLLHELTSKKITSIELLSRGKRGLILKGRLGRRVVSIKTPLASSKAIGTIEKEAFFTKKVNKLGIGPKYLFHTNTYVVRLFVEGELLKDFNKHCTFNQFRTVIKRVLHQMYILDKGFKQKEEMTRPLKHIVVTKGLKPVLLDFERCSYQNNPKNVTQFVQYILSGNVPYKLIKKRKDQVRKLLLAYKEKQNLSNYKRIKDLI